MSKRVWAWIILSFPCHCEGRERVINRGDLPTVSEALSLSSNSTIMDDWNVTPSWADDALARGKSGQVAECCQTRGVCGVVRQSVSKIKRHDPFETAPRRGKIPAGFIDGGEDSEDRGFGGFVP